MKHFLIVSKADKLEEYISISKEYSVSFEINDFFEPKILDNQNKLDSFIETYLKKGIPPESTMHGAFYDIAIFSQDAKIREISEFRMEQSMKIAKILGLKGVVFHANHNPKLSSKTYIQHFVQSTFSYVAKLLEKYPDIDIYIENMFETNPDILNNISQHLIKYRNYGMCLDWAHASLSDVPVTEWAKSTSQYVKHMHINDNDLQNDLHLPIGSGKINWNQFYEYYQKYFQQSSILIETTNPSDQRKSLEYLRKNFDFKQLQ